MTMYLSDLPTEEWFIENGFKVFGEEDNNFSPYYYVGHLDMRYLFRFAKFRNDWGFYVEYTDSPRNIDDGYQYPVFSGITTIGEIKKLIEFIESDKKS